jgi:cytochrome b561
MYWIVALLALAELGIGWSLDYLPVGSQDAEIAALIHIALGIVLAVLVVITPIWRLFARSPDHSHGRPRWLQIALVVFESLLFSLLLVTALTGYLAWAFSGGATPSWTQWLPPSLPIGQHVDALFSQWHEITAIAVTVPIIGTLALLTWSALKRPPRPHHRRVLVPPVATSASEPAPASAPAPAPAPAPASSNEPETPPDEDLLANSRGLARNLKIFGSVAFWVQLCLGLIAVLLLIVTTSSSYYEENQPTLYGFSWGKGIVWAYLSLGVLALTVIGFYSCIVLARSLKRGEMAEGTGASVKRLVSTINFGSALGLTLAILGTAFSIALLISKTVSEPPGIAITNPQSIVRAVDVFVLLANFEIVVAHFIGILICLWILNRLHRFNL